MSECAAAELVEICNVDELAAAIGGGGEAADYTPITDALEEVEAGITAQTTALGTQTTAQTTALGTKLDSIDGHVDGLETAVASTNTKLDTVIGHVDGVETAIASTNTKLDTLHADVDGLETLVGATNTALATLNTTSTRPTPSNATSTAYEASRVVKASAGVLYGLTGYNSKASAQFILLFDSATVPADTAVPKVVISVPATSNFSIDFGPYGRSFSTGIAISNSSTGPTKTIGSADCWFDVQYV